jgi:hypothetical protein
MTAGVQCDTCRRFAPSTPPGWLYLVRPAAEPSILSAFGIGGPKDDPGTFCSMRCLAEYAIVQAAAGEAATGKEPT